MATVTLKGNEIHTSGSLPDVGRKAPEFTLTKGDLSSAKLSDYSGKKVVLNVFHSIDTSTCAASVHQFNTEAAELDNVVVLCISRDLPFALNRFCGAEGIDQVETLSDFKDGNFGKAYGVEYVDGPIEGLLARVIVVIDEDGTVVHTEQVQETSEEPNYKAALEALMDA